MNVKRQWDQVLQPQRYVTQDVKCERRLRLCQRAEVGASLPSDLRPQSVWEIVQALQDGWIIELAQKSLVLVGKAGLRHRHLAHQLFQLGKHGGIDFHPLAGDLGKSVGEGAVKGILSTVHSVVALAQNDSEGARANEVGEGFDFSGLDARIRQRRNRGMNLDAAQLERLGDERTWACVGVKHVGSRAPDQVSVDVLTELARKILPVRSFSGRAKRGYRHVAKTKPGLARRFVPDLGDGSVKMIRIAMERTLAHRRDEAIKRDIVDLIGLDAPRLA